MLAVGGAHYRQPRRADGSAFSTIANRIGRLTRVKCKPLKTPLAEAVESIDVGKIASLQILLLCRTRPAQLCCVDMSSSPEDTNKPGFFQSLIRPLQNIHNPLHAHTDDERISPPNPHARATNSRSVADAAPFPPAPGENLDAPEARKPAALVPANDQLAIFRTLVGIDNAPALHTATFFRTNRPAQNIGIYSRVIHEEAKNHRQHQTFAFLINGCLGLQIVVAAALTALGASNGPHRAIVVFGAVNTVIAGFLAYLKGSGLPNRLKYYENEWTKVREYIEQRERDFCREGCTLDLEAEVFTIERMYEEVRSDVEANTPDTFVSITDIAKRKGAINPTPALADSTMRVIEEAKPRSVAAMKRTLSYQSSQFSPDRAFQIAAYPTEKPLARHSTYPAERPHSEQTLDKETGKEKGDAGHLV